VSALLVNVPKRLWHLELWVPARRSPIRQEIEGFYPEAAIVFDVRDAAQHVHVPLLLSPYGYSTYRGS
jgi:5-hydroxyisourate hydrolase-like protein (transthyretin family)